MVSYGSVQQQSASSVDFSQWQVGNDYECQAMLGCGAYGQVCRARHKPTGQLVAIKRMAKIFQSLGDSVRVLRELSILAKLRDIRIANMVDLIYESADMDKFDTIYVVLEYCEADLQKLLDSSMFLSMNQVIAIMYHVLVGLNSLH